MGKELTHVDLFSGIGGFALAAKWVGIKTVQFVEIDPFCHKALNKNFPGVPIHDDIKTFHYTGPRPFILTGGFPCQPFSCAGKRKGKADDRFLWPQMLRVVSETNPYWVVGENVAGFIDMGLDDCISDLENQGYEVQAFIIPACAVNAPHRRDRVWIVAHSNSSGNGTPRSDFNEQWQKIIEKPNESQSQHGGQDCHAADTGNQRLQGSEWTGSHEQGQTAHGSITERNNTWDEPWIEAATRLCGTFNGLSRELDEIGGLNAKTSNKITRQDLPCLWKGFQSESFQWNIGRFNTIQFEENVFAVLWQYFRKSHRQDNLPFESATVQEAFLRNVWSDQRPGCSPQRWRYNEQYSREHRDALSSMSYEIALEAKKLTDRYGANRVNRLKSLGNAIVPQAAYQIIKVIVEIENG